MREHNNLDFEAERTLAFGGISSSYAAVGAALPYRPIYIRIYNTCNNTGTATTVSFSFDGGTTTHLSVRSTDSPFVLDRETCDRLLMGGQIIKAKSSDTMNAGGVFITVGYIKS